RAIFPQIEYRRAEHGWDRKIKCEKCAGLAVDADQFAAENRGAGTRHARNDRQYLKHSNPEHGGERQSVPVGMTWRWREPLEDENKNTTHDERGRNHLGRNLRG